MMSEGEWLAGQFEENRSRLQEVAYRMVEYREFQVIKAARVWPSTTPSTVMKI